MAVMAMLIDVSKCTACRACQVACKAWNDLPGEITVCAGCYDNPPDLSPDTWNRIAFWEIDEGERLHWAFRPVRCMHCADAPCVRVCPTGALHKNPMGFTAYDESLCNGCGYCTQFCPFDIPRLKDVNRWGQGKATKCTFCQDRATNGLVPACANACHTGAIQYGTRLDMLTAGRERVTVLQSRGYAEANLYGENILGGLGMLYVLTHPPSAFDLPENPSGGLATAWQPWIQALGGVAVGATALGLVLNWLIARKSIKAEEA
ncbi:MAG: 4Fe-4S dicluster domain-containing protein [Anaerolineae bacterium]|nr:4Fe-4S dicluster domain-containing protein [Anaerolineae bacterium]